MKGRIKEIIIHCHMKNRVIEMALMLLDHVEGVCKKGETSLKVTRATGKKTIEQIFTGRLIKKIERWGVEVEVVRE